MVKTQTLYCYKDTDSFIFHIKVVMFMKTLQKILNKDLILQISN